MNHLDQLNEEPQLQAALRFAQQASNSASDTLRSTAHCIGMILDWCDRGKTDKLAADKQRRGIRRASIFSTGEV